ncbi:S24 family peptidase [Pedobacter endophyticus]|uniref:Peptidase S24/S26A/S26B/S26C domain-containing protein n=1 Tax=Pedobacter endophyticus TaxID=2789740 RepID=A0A7U3Q4E3_9SPHI|nr:S24 family peptidase [Pedobacter endophyticus]QPH38400.1 hypothetical protein IZT61_15075 [Pedobacter endophyticus]
MSKYEFYKKTGLSNGFLDKGSNIGSDKCQKISEVFPGLNIAWLITGKGQPRTLYPVDETLHIANEPERPRYRSLKEKLAEDKRIPLYNFNVSEGLTQLFHEPKVVSYIEIPNLPKCDGAITVAGDSMYPIVKAGDIVVYKRVNDLETGIIFGEMYVVSVSIDDQLHTLVRFIKKSDIKNHIQLVGYNNLDAAMDVPLNVVEAVVMVKANISYTTMS